MKYLLDTHSFLWTQFEPVKLSKKAKEIILNQENDLFVSAISFWEISLKYSIGKLILEKVFPDELPIYAKRSGFNIIELDGMIASSFYKLQKNEHCDPFDRMLIWQAISLDMTIITKDNKFKNYKKDGLKTFWN